MTGHILIFEFDTESHAGLGGSKGHDGKLLRRECLTSTR